MVSSLPWQKQRNNDTTPPLSLQIVFEPDLRHGNEAAALVKELRQILVAVGSCKGRMEQGELR